MAAPSGLGEVEQLVKLLAFMGILFYVVGLLAVNGYLFGLGASDFTLARPRFVYTGSLIVATAILPNFLAVQAVLLARKEIRSAAPGLLSRIRVVAVITLLLIMFATIIVFTFDFLLNLPWPDTLIPSGSVILLAGTAVILGLFVALEIRIHSPDLRPSADLRAGAMGLVGLYTLVAFVFYSACFMILAYPNIPQQFGGGKPRPVRILISKEAIPGAQQLGISFPKNAQLSTVTPLLYESSDQYVLRLDNGRTALVDKRIVLGLEHVS